MCLGIASEGGSEPTLHLLKDKTDTVTVAGYKGGWIKVNPGQTGFYRGNPSLKWKRKKKQKAKEQSKKGKK